MFIKRRNACSRMFIRSVQSSFLTLGTMSSQYWEVCLPNTGNGAFLTLGKIDEQGSKGF